MRQEQAGRAASVGSLFCSSRCTMYVCIMAQAVRCTWHHCAGLPFFLTDFGMEMQMCRHRVCIAGNICRTQGLNFCAWVSLLILWHQTEAHIQKSTALTGGHRAELLARNAGISLCISHKLGACTQSSMHMMVLCCDPVWGQTCSHCR